MTNFNWNTIFTLPKKALAGDRRITKEALLHNASLSATDHRLLKKIRTLTHFAVVQKTTTRIPLFVNEERDIQSVIFLRCELIDSGANRELASVLHACFPNPTVIIFEYHGEAHISAAITRRSRAKKGTSIIDSIDSTEVFTIHDEMMQPFLNSLAFDALPQANLEDYLIAIMWNIKLSRLIPSLGFFPSCPQSKSCELVDLADVHEELSSRIDSSIRTRRANTNLAETTLMRCREEELKARLNTVIEKIKEICYE